MLYVRHGVLRFWVGRGVLTENTDGAEWLGAGALREGTKARRRWERFVEGKQGSLPHLGWEFVRKMSVCKVFIR